MAGSVMPPAALIPVLVHARPERGFWRGEFEGRSLYWEPGSDGTTISLPEELVARLEAEPNLIVQRNGESVGVRPGASRGLGATATALAEDAPEPPPPAPDAPVGAGVTIRGSTKSR